MCSRTRSDRLAREDLGRLAVVRGREEELDELLDERLCQRGGDRTVHDHDAAVGRDGIGRERLRVRLLGRVPDGDSAGVRMLHDHARRPVELGCEEPSGGEIAEVVERQLLPL